MKYVQVVVAPTGRRFFVVAAPPGSALGTDLIPQYGRAEVAIPAGIVRFFSNLIRGRWTIAVEEVDDRGRAHGASFHETAPNHDAAERRLTAIVASIEDGSWRM